MSFGFWDILDTAQDVIGGIAAYKSIDAQGEAAKYAREAEQKRAEEQKKKAYGQAIMYRRRADTTDYNARVSWENRRIALWEAEDIRHQAQVQASRKMREARQLKGTQVAQMAASGFLVGAGSFGQILEDTDYLADEDIDTILRNGERMAFRSELEAWSIEQDIELMRRSAASDRVAAMIAKQSGLTLESIGQTTAQAAYRAAKAGQYAQVANLLNRYDQSKFDIG